MIVIDANLAIRAVLPTGEKDLALARLVAWHQNRVDLYAPDILVPEAISVIRKFVYERWITEEEGQDAAQDVFRLGVKVILSDAALGQSALAWAGRLGQARAYDAFYLALAERLGAELWTGDTKLYHRSQQLSLTWVRWAEEA